MIKDDNLLATFTNQKLKFDVIKIERLFYQSISFFKSIDWSNFEMMLFPETSRASVSVFYPQILVSKLICFQKFAHACAKNIFLGQLADFVLIIFINQSTVSFETENIIKGEGRGRGEGGVGREVYVTLPSQIYSSYLCDYKANSVRNIKAFSNAIKNLVVSLLWKISVIHLKNTAEK